MINEVIQKINKFCLLLEGRFNIIITSLIIGLIILGFDMLYITPKFEADFHGLQYSILSDNPFDFNYENSLRYRILPSLIGYLIFLRGDLFFIVPLIFALLFIASIYWSYRKRGYIPTDALLFTSLMAFSCTLFIQLVAPGYTDIVFYFFLFLSFVSVKNIFLSALFFALALLTHESSLFLLPGLLLYSKYINKEKKSIIAKHFIVLLIAVIPLILYRYWVASYIDVEYGFNFYFSKTNVFFTLKKTLPLLPAGLFYAFKLFWFFPMYVLYKTWQKKEFDFFTIIAVIIICDVMQMIIAFDVTRMLCLGFPAILLSAEKLKAEWKPVKFTRFVLILILLNFLIPQGFMSASGFVRMLPFPYTLISNF